jgi:hypothetical protein
MANKWYRSLLKFNGRVGAKPWVVFKALPLRSHPI